MHRPRLAALPLACLLSSLAAEPAAAAPPKEGECPTVTATPEEQQSGADATPIALKEGMFLDQEAMMVLRRLVPPEIWRHREVFFFEGMRMEVGACHRRYPDASFYREATEAHAGAVSLDEQGNLLGYVAGTPFPPESIDEKATDAALKWAWNLVMRFRGAGHRGDFRLSDMPSGLGGVLTYEGSFFLLQNAHRADLASSDYRLPGNDDRLFAAGGEISKPFDARGLAWRQFRSLETESEDYDEPDDVFVYVPSMRKMRRSATTWVDGLFFPRYSASGDGGGGGIAIGGSLGGMGSINPTAAQSIAATEDVRRGFTGLALRPNAYVWRLLGERDVLAPLNASRRGWPFDEERNFGPSGLSVASDRWDVRRAVVIEGALRVPDQDVRTVTIYVDAQTRQPLFWITRTQRRRFLEIGILVHRYTADLADYPEWPGGFPTTVFEPVAAVFYNALAGSGGWRRESYDLLSTPFTEGARTLMNTSDALGRGR